VIGDPARQPVKVLLLLAALAPPEFVPFAGEPLPTPLVVPVPWFVVPVPWLVVPDCAPPGVAVPVPV